MDAGQQVLEDSATTLDALLRMRYASDADLPQRESRVAAYLLNEIRKLRPGSPGARTSAAIIAGAAGLTLSEAETIRCRCLFYGCDDLIALLVNKRIRSDAIAREEAVLYVQDRLQRDDFRRIRGFDAGRGAAFVTYMWQVISNLLLDFMRTQGKRSVRIDNEQIDGLDSAQEGSFREASSAAIEETIEGKNLHELLAQLMTDNSETGGRTNPARDKLRQHLKLSSKERVFLKAMFQYDMSINEIRELPAFQMSANEAYRFYYSIMEQLIECFKSADLLDNLRAEIGATIPRVVLEFAARSLTLPVTSILFFEQESRTTTRCHTAWRGTDGTGTVDESFSRLAKRLAAYFTPISSTQALADRLLTNACDWRQEGILTITGASQPFRVGKRLWSALRARFSGKAAPSVRI